MVRIHPGPPMEHHVDTDCTSSQEAFGLPEEPTDSKPTLPTPENSAVFNLLSPSHQALWKIDQGWKTEFEKSRKLLFGDIKEALELYFEDAPQTEVIQVADVEVETISVGTL